MFHFMKSNFPKVSIFCLLFVLLKVTASYSELLLNDEDSSNRAEHPNVVLILADDLGYGDLSISGHPTSKTTNIDNLAENGKFLTNYYVTSPVCSPSRASLLTGRYQMRSGVYPGAFVPYSVDGLPQNETTIADIFTISGYRTKIIGKWHLGIGRDREFLPGNGFYGFDNFFGLPYGHDMCPVSVCFPNNGSCWTKPIRETKLVSCPLLNNKITIEQPVDLPTLSQRYVNQSLHFIKDSVSERSPFFLYLSAHQIHVPQFASSLFADKSSRGPTGDALLELDWMVGEIVNFVEALGIANNTLTIFTSDNGPSLRHHEQGGNAGLLRCGKGSTWDGGVRVPSLVHWPGTIRPGKSNALVSALDILPTISKILDYQHEHLTLDGMDISNVLFDDAEQSPRKFFAIYSVVPDRESGPLAVIFNEFKAHFYTNGSFLGLSDNDNPDEMCRKPNNLTKHDPPLLYNLNQDPGERYDIGKEPEYREILETITEWRETHMAEMTWMNSQTLTFDTSAQPCCNGTTSCNPFPSCCDCQSPLN